MGVCIATSIAISDEFLLFSGTGQSGTMTLAIYSHWLPEHVRASVRQTDLAEAVEYQVA